jgi:uncharacterized protein YciI
MIFVVLLEDEPSLGNEVRQRHMSEHLDFLELNATAIKVAGPLRDAGDAPAGGLWLVEAESSGQVERLVREDPFWPTGLRRSVQLLVWHQVFADGIRLGASA